METKKHQIAYHKIIDNPMKKNAIVVAFISQFNKIIAVFCSFRVEFYGNIANRGFNVVNRN